MLTFHWIIIFALSIFLDLSRAQLKNVCSEYLSYYFKYLDRHCYYNPNILSDVISMSTRYNYRIEELKTVTEDGYILTVFRIHPRPGTNNKNKPPVFLQHGIIANSASWVDKGTSNRSLAFRLADLGYEVFLGNLRGSTYSKTHTTYKTSDPKFWKFNLDTVAANDIPAMLELVVNITGKEGSTIYIGHSMGTTLYFMFTSSYPDRAKRLIQGGVALAPVVYFPRIELYFFIAKIIYLLDKVGLKYVFYYEDLLHRFLNLSCPLFPPVCFLLQLFGKIISNQFAADDLLLFFSYWPSTSSGPQFGQFAQIALSNKFQKYDYGVTENKQIYGTDNPPLYDLEKITLPTFIFYGSNDLFYSEEAMDKLHNELGSTKKIIQNVPENNSTYAFTHIDFLYSTYLEEFLYAKLFPLLESEFTIV